MIPDLIILACRTLGWIVLVYVFAPLIIAYQTRTSELSLIERVYRGFLSEGLLFVVGTLILAFFGIGAIKVIIKASYSSSEIARDDESAHQ